MVTNQSQPRSLALATLAGVGVGVGVLGLYVVGGLVVAGWSVDDFLAHLDVEVLGSLLLAGGIAVSCFAVPVAAYLRYRVVSPLVVLLLVVVGWVVYGVATGVLTPQTVFGLAIYALFLAPAYLVLYGAVGVVEYRYG